MAIYGRKHELQLRLMVDKKKMKLVYAECNRSMADVLFGFLTTPVGAFVRRTGKSSGLQCMDNIYKSVEDMNVDNFTTPACKELLLRPRDAWGFSVERLKLRINDVDDARYFCPDKPTCLGMGSLPNSDCICGRMLSVKKYQQKGSLVFVRDGLGTFVITDDLFMAPSSPAVKRKICSFVGAEDPSLLEEKIVTVAFEQLLQLMKFALVSNTPLTDTFLPSDFIRSKTINPLPEASDTHSTNFWTWIIKGIENLHWKYSKKKMEIIVFYDQKKSKIGLVKAGKDFVDLLFSFLIFPFGSISAASGRQSCLGSIDNLHKTIKKFIRDQNTISLGDLSDPPIAPHHQSETGLLNLGSEPYSTYWIQCEACREQDMINCVHYYKGNPRYKWVNPKYDEATTKKGGGYMRQPALFFISNALVVHPIFDDVAYGIPKDLEAKKIVFGPKEALELLKASIVSEDPLTAAFSHLL